jgi:hypothetical protein
MNQELVDEFARIGAMRAERYANEVSVALLPEEWQEIGRLLQGWDVEARQSDAVKTILWFIECMKEDMGDQA